MAEETNRLVAISARAPSQNTVELVLEALIRDWPTLTGLDQPGPRVSVLAAATDQAEP